jgi:hypothetical protein
MPECPDAVTTYPFRRLTTPLISAVHTAVGIRAIYTQTTEPNINATLAL